MSYIILKQIFEGTNLKKEYCLKFNDLLRIYQPMASTFGLCGPLDLSPSQVTFKLR